MGYSIGYDREHDRDIGYGVPAFCDFPGCHVEINRGMGYICGNYGDDHSCGLYFCSHHKEYHEFMDGDSGLYCHRCATGKHEYKRISKEHPKWIRFKLTDISWKEWREKNPSKVREHTKYLNIHELF